MPLEVPYIPQEEIEQKAETVINFGNPDVLKEPSPSPISEVLDRLHSDYKIPLDLEADLGRYGGKKIQGKFNLKTRKISIDSSLGFGSHRWNFTTAHELGHLALHRDLDFKRSIHISDTEESFEIVKDKRMSGIERMEFQANLFAGAFLIPRATVEAALIYVQLKEDVKINFGKIYVNSEPYSQRDLLLTLSSLSEIYNVSKEAVKRRLKTLGVIVDERELDNVYSFDDLFRIE